MRIMIGGGYDVENPESTAAKNTMKFAEALASAVIEQGHSVVAGNLTPFDKIVLESAEAALEDKEVEKNRVRSYRPKGSDGFANAGIVLNSELENWEKVGPKLRYPEPIWESDVVVLVAGWQGARTAATWAKLAGRPIFPVASFGLAAEEIFSEIRAETMARPDIQITEEEFDILKSAVDILTDDQAASLASNIVSLAEKMILPRDVFVVMSYKDDPSLADAYSAFVEACNMHGFEADRLDKLELGETYEINDAIKERLRSCAFSIVDLTDNRPNVYYELGFAQALGKPVILTKKKGTKIHFDVSGQKILEWTGFLDARDQVKSAVGKVAEKFGA